MIFDEYFDKVVVLSLPNRHKRLDSCLENLFDRGLSRSPVVAKGIFGDTVGISAYFKSGGGAWGCMFSHIRIIQDFLMEELFEKDKKAFETKKMLIIEDDAIFCEGADSKFKNFVSKVPSNWGQLYLGGQHTRKPEKYCSGVYKGSSINRTHAFAVQGRHLQQIHRHITYAPDYQGKSTHHIDHQLEVAHRRGDWPIYCPEWWLCGQSESRSDIRWRNTDEMWWDYSSGGDIDNLPVVVGFSDNPNPRIFYSKDEKTAIDSLCNSSWDRRRIPYIKISTEVEFEKIKLSRRGEIFVLPDSNEEQTKQIEEIKQKLPWN